MNGAESDHLFAKLSIASGRYITSISANNHDKRKPRRVWSKAKNLLHTTPPADLKTREEYEYVGGPWQLSLQKSQQQKGEDVDGTKRQSSGSIGFWLSTPCWDSFIPRAGDSSKGSPPNCDYFRQIVAIGYSTCLAFFTEVRHWDGLPGLVIARLATIPSVMVLVLSGSRMLR